MAHLKTTFLEMRIMGDTEGTQVDNNQENFIVGFVKTHILQWPKSPNQQLVRMWCNLNSHLLLMEIRNGSTTLENSVASFLER